MPAPLSWHSLKTLRRAASAACVGVLSIAGATEALLAQEIQGVARLNSRGELVWGAAVTLIDSLGREAATGRTNSRGEFSLRAPVPGTYWLQLSTREVGRNASPVFVLDSGMTLRYEHVFQQSLSAMVRGESQTAQLVLQGPFRDSTHGVVKRFVGNGGAPHVTVSVVDAASGSPLANAEVALVSVDSRLESVAGGTTGADGVAGWRGAQQAWYRVIGRRIGYEPGGTHSFPIVGDADSIHITLSLGTVTVLDAVTVMAQRIDAFGFNQKLMSRFFLGGDELRKRNPAARNVDDLITSLNIPGLGVQTGAVRSIMSYRGQKVRVFILDGSRTSGELPLVEPGSIESLMFIPPNEAGAIFGPDASGGVLIINTRKR